MKMYVSYSVVIISRSSTCSTNLRLWQVLFVIINLFKDDKIMVIFCLSLVLVQDVCNNASGILRPVHYLI